MDLHDRNIVLLKQTQAALKQKSLEIEELERVNKQLVRETHRLRKELAKERAKE